MKDITVLGAGGWGTTLAIHLLLNGYRVSLWEFQPERAEELRRSRENRRLLPGVAIPEDVYISSDLEELITLQTGMVVFAVPSDAMRQVARKVARLGFGSPIILSVAKGIETDTLKRMSEVLADELPARVDRKIAVLSGPSHAEEVSQQIPTTVVAASADAEVAREVQRAFMSPHFRVYTNDDVIGVELGSSLKNIIAIAVGIIDGLGLGDNTKGALLTRGLAEITRLGLAMGAKAATFAGLSGMGDLVTTCISRHSRNRYLGEQIGKGKTLDEVLAEMVMVAEGVKTTRSAHRLSRKFRVEMPITDEVYAVLFENKSPARAVNELMMREAKAEVWEEYELERRTV